VNNVEYGVALPPLYDNPTSAFHNTDGIHVELIYNPSDTTGTGASTISVYVTGNDGNYPRTKVLEAKGPKFDGDVFMGWTAATGGATMNIHVDNFVVTELCCEVDDSVTIAQQAPVNIALTNMVTLDASASSGGDGAPLSFTWEVTAGNAEFVGGNTGAMPQLKLNSEGDVTVKVTAGDSICGDGATATMTFSVFCEDDPDTAVIVAPAGPFESGSTVTLDSAGSTAGSRTWSIVSGAGEIVGSATDNTVQVKGNAEGNVVVKLVVDDAVCANPGSAEVTLAFVVSATWIRCDANGDKALDISDPVFSLAFQFTGGPASGCPNSLDCNGDGSIDISDPVFDLQFQFLGGPMPPAPYPACDNFPGCAKNCP